MEEILRLFNKRRELDSYVRLAMAELHFCFENEMVIKPLDFFIRRSGRLYFDIGRIENVKVLVLEEFSKRFQWNAMELVQNQKELETEIRNSYNFD